MSTHRENDAARAPQRLLGTHCGSAIETRDLWVGSGLTTSGKTSLVPHGDLGADGAFTLSAIGAIFLAVGAATAVFSVVDEAFFRPLPVASEVTAWFRWR